MAGNLTALDTIDGGAGTDTVVSSVAISSATMLGGLSNVEILSLEGVSATLAADVNPAIIYMSNSGNEPLTLISVMPK